MNIIKIIRKQETKEEIYTEITFKPFWGKQFTETCITHKHASKTTIAKTGDWIPSELWDTVTAFLRTGDPMHEY